MTDKCGKVFLIGAGPGDPGLLTIKAKNCIETADVVVYDYLASPFLLDYARPDAEIIYVGKKGGDHTLTQDKINLLLVEKAKQGFDVARLKGGDPFVFGRGGEEAQMLLDHDVSYEIVPGVTSAIAAPAYAGIPVTHREHTSFVSFITGHEDPTKKDSSMQWDVYAKSNATLVFLMGVKNLPNIVKNLMNHGKAPDTPAALVRWGTTTRQRTVTGTLGTIVGEVKRAGLKSPAIIVVGDVVTLREKMQWFEDRPLFGRKMVVTRAREQASDLVVRLAERGAECIECPTIKVVPPEDQAPLDAAIHGLFDYDWLVFTSVNGVNFFFDRLFALGKDVRALGGLKTATIGPATAARLRDFGVTSDIIPESYRAESVVDAFRDLPMAGQKVLLPRAEEARAVLPVELRKMDAAVDEITSYRTRLDDSGKEELLTLLEAGAVDLVTFTSSSTVRNFKALLPEERFEELMEGVTVASIGPITSDTAKELGFKVDVSADEYTIPGLVAAIMANYTA